MTTCGGCHFSFLGPFASNATPRSTMPADDVHDGWVASAAGETETLCEFIDIETRGYHQLQTECLIDLLLPESATTQSNCTMALAENHWTPR